jgi:hypothetical protein
VHAPRLLHRLLESSPSRPRRSPGPMDGRKGHANCSRWVRVRPAFHASVDDGNDRHSGIEPPAGGVRVVGGPSIRCCRPRGQC